MPTSIIFMVTNKCNSRCTTCNLWKNKNVKDLDYKIYNNLPSSLNFIGLTGGEPILRNDLIEIVKILNRKCNKPKFNLATNGLAPGLIEEKLREILKITKNISVRISIDGIGESHDKIRGIKGSFENAMRTISVCKKLGIKDLGISPVMQDKNLDEIKKVYMLSRKLKIEFNISPVENGRRYGKFDNRLSKIGRIKEILNFMIKNELKSAKPKSWFRAFYYYGLFHYLKGKIVGKRKMIMPCLALEKLFLLDPSGNVVPCTLLDNKIGSIKDENFRELWTSGKAQDARRMIKKCPGCWEGCNINTAIRKNKSRVLFWILKNKIRAHLGEDILK